MPETVTGKFQVVDSKGNVVLTVDADSQFVQITYEVLGQKLAEMTNTGHLGLFSGVTGQENVRLDPFNVPGQPCLTVTAGEGNIAIQGVGSSSGQAGVLGVGTGDQGFGVVGMGSGASGFGVVGNSNFGAGTGVHGHTSTGVGVLGTTDGAGPAGRFEGNVEVSGDLTASSNINLAKDLNVKGDAFVSGTLNVVADIVLAGPGDCAEDFDIADIHNADPGTVMVVNGSGSLQPSEKAYDKKVVGVISGAGECRPGMILGRRDSMQARSPIALAGTVYCKADAQYAPIEVGDLLTTSPTLGHAMKVTNHAMAFGAVIGKALAGLRGGQGLVPILIALQ